MQRWRVHEIMRKIDPVGTALCWNQVVYHRKYSVPGASALWHYRWASQAYSLAACCACMYRWI